MTPKQIKAQTERNIRAIVLAIQKPAMAIGYRFGDIDQVMVSAADELLAMVDRWADEQRKYIENCVTEGIWTGI
ncbi:hypothetical protein [Acidicapsa acidisoli]|uniref:hypothetical protein n=1 Tax=Acidicapsa acidisoli TaxID=1615681 RepID=UPI0021E0A566|nr:hypothetical protein [Acidicapsa acidisoli]